MIKYETYEQIPADATLNNIIWTRKTLWRELRKSRLTETIQPANFYMQPVRMEKPSKKYPIGRYVYTTRIVLESPHGIKATGFIETWNVCPRDAAYITGVKEKIVPEKIWNTLNLDCTVHFDDPEHWEQNPSEQEIAFAGIEHFQSLEVRCSIMKFMMLKGNVGCQPAHEGTPDASQWAERLAYTHRYDREHANWASRFTRAETDFYKHHNLDALKMVISDRADFLVEMFKEAANWVNDVNFVTEPYSEYDAIGCYEDYEAFVLKRYGAFLFPDYINDCVLVNGHRLNDVVLSQGYQVFNGFNGGVLGDVWVFR